MPLGSPGFLFFSQKGLHPDDGGTLMPIFKIWHRGSKEVSIEEGISPGEACQKAGWRSEECEVQLIPENEILNLNEPLPER